MKMTNETNEISKAMSTDTSKMKSWQIALQDTIWNEWTKKIEKNQITVWLDKREKEISEKREPNK